MPRTPETSPNRPLFDLGQTLATPGALAALEESQEDPRRFLYRHVTGDWSEMDPHDQEANRQAVHDDTRIFSAYKLRNGQKLWVITEWDRSATTLLLPSEY